MESLLEAIKTKKPTCYFISPHFDDAMLSAGALIVYLSAYTDIVIINVFTKAGEKPYTLSTKAYLKQCGYKDANDLYHDRRQEDRKVMKHFVKQTINLGFVDALWRKKEIRSFIGKKIPEFNHIYPTYKFHIIKGKVSKRDEQTIRLLKSKLKELVDKDNAIVFCPIGIGNHVDHIIVSDVCESLFQNCILWSDFPYDLQTTKSEKTMGKQVYTFSKDLQNKVALIQGYKTQFKAMFKEGLQTKQEIYYTMLTPEKI